MQDTITDKIKQRKNWIDWMKVLGIFFIIWGHAFPPYMRYFIYAFNVPVFFLISGYLSKPETSWKVFFTKNWHTLLVPYFIVCAIKRMGMWVNHLDDGRALKSVIGVLTGCHKFDGVHAATMMWFVFTLFVMKLFFQLCCKGRHGMALLTLGCLIGTVIYNYSGVEWSWSGTNALLGMPFFALGYACSAHWKSRFDALCVRLKGLGGLRLMSGALVMFVAVWLAAPLNTGMEMFKGSYGASLPLFLLLGLTGSYAVLLLSLALDGIHSRHLVALSSGTLVILGFHLDLAHPLEKPLQNLSDGSPLYDIGTFFTSLLVLLAFIPIIYLVKRFFPVLLGRRKF